MSSKYNVVDGKFECPHCGRLYAHKSTVSSHAGKCTGEKAKKTTPVKTPVKTRATREEQLAELVKLLKEKAIDMGTYMEYKRQIESESSESESTGSVCTESVCTDEGDEETEEEKRVSAKLKIPFYTPLEDGGFNIEAFNLENVFGSMENKQKKVDEYKSRILVSPSKRVVEQLFIEFIKPLIKYVGNGEKGLDENGLIYMRGVNGKLCKYNALPGEATSTMEVQAHIPSDIYVKFVVDILTYAGTEAIEDVLQSSEEVGVLRNDMLSGDYDSIYGEDNGICHALHKVLLAPDMKDVSFKLIKKLT
jgi:hypothetical protein